MDSPSLTDIEAMFLYFIFIYKIYTYRLDKTIPRMNESPDELPEKQISTDYIDDKESPNTNEQLQK